MMHDGAHPTSNCRTLNMPNTYSHFQSAFSKKLHAKKRDKAQEINAHKKIMSGTRRAQLYRRRCHR